MKSLRFQISTVMILLVLFLYGCSASQKEINHGNHALRSGNPHAAVDYFEKALSLDSKLSRRKSFNKNLNQARFEAALIDAKQHINIKRFDLAIADYQKALKAKPGDQNTLQRLTEIKPKAAEQRYHQAIQAADRNNRTNAERALKQALIYDTTHANALAALASLTGSNQHLTSNDDKQFAKVTQLIHDQKWQTALPLLEQIIQNEPNRLPARFQRHRVKTTITQTNTALNQAISQNKNKQLHESLTTLKKAQQLSPHNQAVLKLTGLVTKKLDEVNQLTESAKKAITLAKWDDAIAQLNSAMALCPTDPTANELNRQVRGLAANQYHKLGREQMTQGKMTQANALFHKALQYDSKHTASRLGLSNIALHFAMIEVKAGHLGQALLWSMNAAQHLNDSSNQKRVSTLSQTIAAQAGFSISVNPMQGNGATGETEDFIRDLMTQLKKDSPAFVRLNQKVGQNHFSLSPNVTRLRVSQEQISTQAKTHDYYIAHRVTNRDYYHAKDMLRMAIRNHDHELDKYYLIKDQIDLLKSSANSDNKKKQQRISRLERNLNSQWKRVKKSDGPVNHWKSQLFSLKKTIIEKRLATWHYSVETIAKRGKANARIDVHDSTGLLKIAAITTSDTFEKMDTMTHNAHPKLGVSEDSLDLPSNTTVEQSMISNMATKASKQLVQTLLQAHLDQLDTKQRTATIKGDLITAQKLTVDKLVLQWLGGNQSAKQQLKHLAMQLEP